MIHKTNSFFVNFGLIKYTLQSLLTCSTNGTLPLVNVFRFTFKFHNRSLTKLQNQQFFFPITFYTCNVVLTGLKIQWFMKYSQNTIDQAFGAEKNPIQLILDKSYSSLFVYNISICFTDPQHTWYKSSLIIWVKWNKPWMRQFKDRSPLTAPKTPKYQVFA